MVGGVPGGEAGDGEYDSVVGFEAVAGTAATERDGGPVLLVLGQVSEFCVPLAGERSAAHRRTPFGADLFPGIAISVKIYDHRKMHPISELAALLCPLPEPGSVTPEDCFADACEQSELQRTQYADNLEAAALATDEDPLILALEQARTQKEEADRRIRLLLAYAREFQPARRYPLRELSQASGYTISGVTTAYGTPEITLVQRQLHRSPVRRRDAS